ncbi:MS Related Protein [Caenorhabditis elegans]|uniref:MS Related Protein n=1 Tax=Caenorhabditis elegans TaxID=6239 RepID=W6RTJ0_CAEEL|nr:MS Related Protein [Caenorhabditis elegans]CDM63528.1 MS Related Protein [Caenorhabditis elegans]|eukprot:NP_001294171.1 Uncharacterized protein CELE_T14A8.2 [Caenorhabditis elegans]
MSSTKSLIVLALLAISALASPSLRHERAPGPQTEAIGEFQKDGTTAELGPGDDTPAQFEEEASGEEEDHHEHHMEASGEAPVDSSSTAPMSSDEPKIEETTEETTEETPVLSKEPEVEESKPIEAATVVSAVEDQPSTSETSSSSSEEPSTSSETPVSSATSFVSSLFVLVCVYLIAM